MSINSIDVVANKLEDNCGREEKYARRMKRVGRIDVVERCVRGIISNCSQHDSSLSSND